MMGSMFGGMGMFWMWLFPLAVVFIAFAVIALARHGVSLFGTRQVDTTSGGGERSVETQIIRLAVKHDGVLTVTDVAIATGLPIPRSEEVLQKMVDGQRVSMHVKDSGVVIYEFPEILDKVKKEERGE